jgi:hypothetical protein
MALVVAATSGLCGCLAAVRAFQEGRTCTPEAAREAGIDDAQSGRLLDEDYAQICGVAESSLNRIYRDAYDGVPPGERDARSWLDRLLRRDRARDRAAEAPPR